MEFLRASKLLVSATFHSRDYSHLIKSYVANLSRLSEAGTSNADFVAIENLDKQMWGLQFHPEVTHSPRGKDILKNFVVDIAKAKQDWVMTDYANE